MLGALHSISKLFYSINTILFIEKKKLRKLEPEYVRKQVRYYNILIVLYCIYAYEQKILNWVLPLKYLLKIKHYRSIIYLPYLTHTNQ